MIKAQTPRTGPKGGRASARLILSLPALCISVAILPGCTAGPDDRLRALVDRGEYAAAAERAAKRLTRDRGNRQYMLDRMRLGIALLAAGRPADAEPVMNEAFEILRTQGINDDKTVAAAVLGEGGVIFWKGEPFEQALMLHYIAVQKALLGEWDNARAAAQASLFLLRDFGENERGERKSRIDIAQEAYRQSAGDDRAYDAYFDSGYTPARTDFALGYFMAGLANLALSRTIGDPDRENEARDHFREAFMLAPSLRPVADALIEGRANTVFVIDSGPGPGKVRYGPDGALALFVPRGSGPERIEVVIEAEPVSQSGSAARVGGSLACDVDRMASDHMWNSLEDARKAKSAIGNAMLLAGIFAAASRDSRAQIVGWSLLGAGMLSKLTAGADVRHCEVLPKSVHVAATEIRAPATARVEWPGASNGGPTLALAPPGPESPLVLHYVRIPALAPAEGRPWSESIRGLARYNFRASHEGVQP